MSRLSDLIERMDDEGRRVDRVVRRFDRGTLEPIEMVTTDPLALPETHDSGFVRVEGRISRVGIQDYVDGAGKVRRELRPPEEVFDAASLRSFHMVPVTDGHPDKLLDPISVKAHSVGAVGESVRPVGDHVAASMMIHDHAALASIQSGRTQLSCGYTAEMEETPGVWNGQPYDAIQRKIRGNHLALVDAARAGPQASLRLDARDAASTGLADGKSSMLVSQSPDTQFPSTESRPMAKTLRIDGTDIELSESNATTIQNLLDRGAAHAKSKQDQAISIERDRADGLQKELDAARAKVENAKKNVIAFKSRVDGDALAIACPFCDVDGHFTKLDGENEKCACCDGTGEMPAALLGETPDMSGIVGDALVADSAKVDSAKAALSDKARADRAAKLSDALRQHVDSAVEHRVAKRAALRVAAERVLGHEEAAKLDGKSESEIKLAVAQYKNKSMKLDGRDPIYISALFDKAVGEAASPADEVRGAVLAPTLPLPRGDGSLNPHAARDRMAARNADAWKLKSKDVSK